jgi:uncharacterized protein (DUF934 family)
MPLIRASEVISDTWTVLPDEDPLPAEGEVLVSLPRFLSERAALTAAASGRLGVALSPTDDARAFGGDFAGVSLITAQFPIFRDGRAYSQAAILRQSGYQGALRAVGDVLVDQVFFMQRVGFSELFLRDDKSVNDALKALDAFSYVYADAPDGRPVVPQQRAAQPSQ